MINYCQSCLKPIRMNQKRLIVMYYTKSNYKGYDYFHWNKKCSVAIRSKP